METTSTITESFETTFAVLTSETATETETVETTTAAVSTADLSALAEIDVDMLNTFTYLGSAFVIGFFFFFVCKGAYRLFNMFF